MLRELFVRDLAVLAEASVRFGPGLNVLSGETGAGKSLVVDSLALLAGARASSELIRRGAESLTVSGVFEPASDAWHGILEEAGVAVEEPSSVMVRREVSRSGRNRVFVNDQPVTLRLLASLAAGLLRIQTQREELGLFSPELQRRWLDLAGGDEAGPLLAATAACFARHAEAAARLERAAGGERLRLERIDLLRFQAAEIDAVRLQAGEEVELAREREALRHSEAITAALGTSHAALAEEEGAAVELLARSQRLLDEVSAWEPEAAAWVGELEEVRIRLEELARAVRSRLASVEADPRRLDAIEERLAVIERLCRKYGDTTAEVLAHRERIGGELEDLQADDERRDELEARVQDALGDYRVAALELSARRRGWGSRLAERIHAELADLAMAKARFAVRVERRSAAGSALAVEGRPVEFSAAGIDQVAFELTANPGEDASPLARVASGGELSRVYLALQLALLAEEAERQPTLVFDEVDAGIGGAQAAALGRKLQRLARSRQVLVVTHLPQVASHADRHYRVRKRVVAGRARMSVEGLDDGARVEELARMLAGRKVTELSRSHARELIETASRGRT